MGTRQEMEDTERKIMQNVKINCNTSASSWIPDKTLPERKKTKEHCTVSDLIKQQSNLSPWINCLPMS